MHWILPYPNNEMFWSQTHDGWLQTWSSVQPSMMAFYQQLGSQAPPVFSSNNWDMLLITGWECDTTACPLHIMLPVILDELKPMLAMVKPSPSTSPHPEIPLPLWGVHEMVLLEYLHQIMPAHQELCSFC